MSDIENDDWRCGCGHTNPDCDLFCNECLEGHFPIEEEPESLSNLYSDESHRMQQAMELKR